MIDCRVGDLLSGDDDDDDLGAATTTVAKGTTSTGDRIAFALHPNPNKNSDESDSCAKFGGLKAADTRAIAAHGNSILLSCIFSVRDPISPYIASLREELFVYRYKHLAAVGAAYDGGFWGTNWLPIRHAAGEDQDLCWWETDLVVPLGDDSLLCWVDYLRGILFCDVFSPIPEFLYVWLPVNPYPGSYDQELAMRGSMHVYRSVCVTKNGGMKFVDVACFQKLLVFSDRLSWIKNASLDANVFFSLANDEVHLLPRIVPKFPLVDMEDPNAIYFSLPLEEGCNDKAALVILDMLRKTLRLRNSYTVRSTLEPGDDSSSTSCNLFCNEPFLPFEFST
uniref:DUF1618 domain-containing protein n=1 Tax=Oryza meridionalis TaxID=40149 RepID=A0A0E0C4L1_9ORYZ